MSNVGRGQTVSMINAPSYRDLHITTKDIERSSIDDLVRGIQVFCTALDGWTVWNYNFRPAEKLGGEFGGGGLRLDVGGHVIVDSLTAEEEG